MKIEEQCISADSRIGNHLIDSPFVRGHLINTTVRFFLSCALLLFSIGFISINLSWQAYASDDNAEMKAEIPNAIYESGKEYKLLRPLEGHFSMKGWNDDIDKWNGKKHWHMKILADFFNAQSVDLIYLEEIMGKPDDSWQKGNEPKWYWVSRIQNKIMKSEAPPVTKYIYYWRGRRDFLEVQVQQGKTSKAIWRYSYE